MKHVQAAQMLALAMLAGCLAGSAMGHATLEKPRARNVLATDAGVMDNEWWNVEYCPHCKNMGGVDHVSAGRSLQWPEGRRSPNGVCGDAFDDPQADYLLGGAKYDKIWSKKVWGATYRQGQKFQTDTRFFTYHRGYVQLKMCIIHNWSPEREQRLLTNDCFEKGPRIKQAWGGAQPGSDVWYLENGGFTGIDGNGLYAEAWQGVASTIWRLPKWVSCNFHSDGKKCIMRMEYITGNSCKRPNTPPQYQKYLVNEVGECGAPGVAYPEEFYNCADLRIRPKKTGTFAQGGNGTNDPAIEILHPLDTTLTLPPDSPLTTCADSSTLECFCKGRDVDRIGYAANPWDKSRSSYLGCNLAGYTLAWQCPPRTAFHDKSNSCRVNNGKQAPGRKGFRCYPGSEFALKKDPKGGDLQCWSKDMQACTPVCDASAAASAPFQTPSLGTLTCGAVMGVLKKTVGYNQPGHWCAEGCKAIGGC